MARCIVREVKEGRGSPHGGVFLELDTFAKWMQKRGSFNAAEHWKKKLPSMYHQFKELGNLDITKTADGSRPDDALRHGRRPRRSRQPDVARSPACSPAANVRPASTGPTGSAAIRCPTCWCSASGPASSRPSLPRTKSPGQVDDDQVEDAARWALSFIDAPAGDENPYKVQQDLQEMMQDLVGIVRKQDEMVKALEGLEKLWDRAEKARASVNREYNPGWHTCMDLNNLMTVSEAVTRAAIERKESRGGQFRDDYPEEGQQELRPGQHRRLEGAPTAGCSSAGRRSPRCRRN